VVTRGDLSDGGQATSGSLEPGTVIEIRDTPEPKGSEKSDLHV
jgi:hypothetical protein